MSKIPVTVIVATKNEERRIGACLAALSDFDEVIVVDSASDDRTAEIAREYGARVFPFFWNGRYPKKRQWCLDHIDTRHDFIFFVDADEIVTPELCREISRLSFARAGYFVPGRYVWNGRALRFGLRNKKLALIDRRKMGFPPVDDLDIPGMGEIEGHYQPVLKPDYAGAKIGRLRRALIHEAQEGWEARHLRYAAWERGMNEKGAWPGDPSPLRQAMKRIFRAAPGRGVIAFLHCYLFKLGFLDGRAGYDFARSRARYYAMISGPSTGGETPCGTSTAPSALRKS